MTKALAQTYTLAMEYRTRITTACIVACFAFILLYALNVYAVISHTVALQRTQGKLSALNTSVVSLDSRYLELSDKITPAALHEYGMSQVQVSEFISRSASFSRVALGGHEL